MRRTHFFAEKSGAPLPYKVLLRRNRSLKIFKKKKKKKKKPWLNHESTMGNWVADRTIQAVPQFFFACGAIFPFLLRKKGFDV